MSSSSTYDAYPGASTFDTPIFLKPAWSTLMTPPTHEPDPNWQLPPDATGVALYDYDGTGEHRDVVRLDALQALAALGLVVRCAHCAKLGHARWHAAATAADLRGKDAPAGPPATPDEIAAQLAAYAAAYPVPAPPSGPTAG